MADPRRDLRATVTGLLLAVSVILGVVVLAPPPPAGADDGVSLGVFRGSGRADLVDDYEDWLRVDLDYVVDFVGGMPAGSPDPWQKIDAPDWWCRQWSGRSEKLVLSTAILPTWDQTLAAGAAGEYDAHWRRFGERLVAGGCEDTILRLGWEFNGKFYPWAAGGHEREFVAYWRRIVSVLRGVPGTNFSFDWCPLKGNVNADVEAAYPGDDVVDIIGLDAYDASPVPVTDLGGRWSDHVNTRYGLAWQASFAAAHRKPLSFPEWGITVRKADGLGGGDNPDYIRRMWDWIQTHNVLYASYFEVDAHDAAHALMSPRFPASSSELRLLAAGDAGAADSGRVSRLAGGDRVATAVAVSKDVFGDHAASAAVLASSARYADALVGSPLAVSTGGPLLLTSADRLSATTRTELQRVLPSGSTVYLVGGTSVLSPAVADQVAALGLRVVRIGGVDRYETSVLIARTVRANPGTILVATGSTFPDALAAGAAAAHVGGVVLLSDGSSLPAAVRAYLAEHRSVPVYGVGTPAATATPGATPLAGRDRYETALAVAQRFFPKPPVVGFATGLDFPDALAGAAHVGRAGGPLLLVAPGGPTPGVSSYLQARRSGIERAVVFGGTSVVPEVARTTLARDLTA